MLRQLTRYVTLLSFIFFLHLSCPAQTTISALKNKLAEADNLHDSIVVYYNIYELSPIGQKSKVIDEIYEIAARGGDWSTAHNVLKLGSALNESNDSILQSYASKVERLPNCEQKKSTTTFINILLNSNHAKRLPKEQQQSKLRDYLTQYTMSKEFETFARIEYLFQICTYLRMITEGELLTNYLQELQTLIERLPPDDIALKYLFYTQAADVYLLNDKFAEGIDANKKLLEIINILKKNAENKGYSFRGYDNSAFLCYSRLLRSYEYLPTDEIIEYYNEIVPLIEAYPEFQEISGQGKIPLIYFSMAKKHYQDAIPLIKEQLNSGNVTTIERLYLTRALLTAAEALGDNETLMSALEISNELLRDRIETKAANSYNDLQMIYEVNGLKQTNDELEVVNQHIEINRHKELLSYATTTLIVLVCLLIIIFILYRRSKHLTANLTKSNLMVTDERDAIQLAQKDLVEASSEAKLANRVKEDFVKSMGHEIRTPLEFIVEYSELIADCSPKDRREYIKRFANMISLNSDLLLSLVNKVLDLPSLDKAKERFNITKLSANDLCEEAIAEVRDSVRPGVIIKFVNDVHADSLIMTDHERVKQVLVNLLSNAAKYTLAGTIELEYALSKEKDKMIFTVTDTGPGIPEEKETEIFSRFSKHIPAPGSKFIGLYICRLLAKMLGGNLSLDRDYHSGAKFVFSITIL